MHGAYIDLYDKQPDGGGPLTTIDQSLYLMGKSGGEALLQEGSQSISSHCQGINGKRLQRKGVREIDGRRDHGTKGQIERRVSHV